MTKSELINCYHKDSFSGVGDFFRGCIYLYDKCALNNVKFNASFGNHPMGQYIGFKSEVDVDSDFIYDIPFQHSICNDKQGLHQFSNLEIEKIISVIKGMDGGRKFVFTNYHHVLENDSLHAMNAINALQLNLNMISWFKENFYFSQEIEDHASSYMDDNDIKEKDFNVLHFRLGDQNYFHDENEIDKQYFFDIINRQERKKTVILSDSNVLKSIIKDNEKKFKFPVFINHLESSHTQSNTGVDLLKTKDLASFYSAFDLCILSKSSKVSAYSSYFWGSGFTCWISKLLSIPFLCKPFIKKGQLYQY